MFFPNLTASNRPETLHCPDCDVLMTPFSCREAIIEKCQDCQGIWFEGGELGLFRETLAQFDLSKIKIVQQPEESTGEIVISSCPTCKDVLDEFTYSYNTKVHLKRCKKCHGIWSPLVQTMRLIELTKISQAVESDVRALAGDFAEKVQEDAEWKQLERAGETLSQRTLLGARWSKAILPIGDDVIRTTFPKVTVAFLGS
jgi:Zn-finger nucleic acid-binding protein